MRRSYNFRARVSTQKNLLTSFEALTKYNNNEVFMIEAKQGDYFLTPIRKGEEGPEYYLIDEFGSGTWKPINQLTKLIPPYSTRNTRVMNIEDIVYSFEYDKCSYNNLNPYCDIDFYAYDYTVKTDRIDFSRFNCFDLTKVIPQDFNFALSLIRSGYRMRDVLTGRTYFMVGESLCMGDNSMEITMGDPKLLDYQLSSRCWDFVGSAFGNNKHIIDRFGWKFVR